MIILFLLERIHHEIEAGRLAYRDRNLYLADPEFSDVPVTAMLSSEHADFIRAQINPNKALDTFLRALCLSTKARFILVLLIRIVTLAVL